MATPNRNYTEIPGGVVPDVPYRVNLALREIDADINDLEKQKIPAGLAAARAFASELVLAARAYAADLVSAARGYTAAEVAKDRQRLTAGEATDTVHANRLRALEALGGLAPGETSDATVAALLANPETLTGQRLDGFVRRNMAGALSSGTTDYAKILDTSDATASTFRWEDEAAHQGSILNIHHRGQAGSGQAYGLNIANHDGAKQAIVVHQYSKNGPAMQIDNTDLAAGIFIKNTPNTVQNPDGVQRGDFLQFKPGTEEVDRLILQDSLTWWNQTKNDMTVRADNATTHALGVTTSKDIKALAVEKSGTGAGNAAEIVNRGTGSGLHINQTGAGTGLSVSANTEASFGKAAALVNGYTHAGQFSTFADGGAALLANKNSTGTGDAVRIINKGTGPSMNVQNAAGPVSRVNADGEYEHLTPGAGIILRSPDGSRFRLTVSNTGQIAAAKL